MTQRTAVVTGASSGIGAATARALVAAGLNVVAVARRADRLAALAAEIGCQTVSTDITQQLDVDTLVTAIDRCDVLVNNAGGAFGLQPVSQADDVAWTSMWEVNVMGTLRVTRALLPKLIKTGDGVVVTVTSTAAHGVYEGGAGYAAAKHAERAMVETMRLELCGQPVRICEIAPGMVKTEEFSLNRFDGDSDRAAKVYEGVQAPLSAEDVAEAITWMATRPSHVNIDSMTIRPRAQAAQYKIHREP